MNPADWAAEFTVWVGVVTVRRMDGERRSNARLRGARGERGETQEQVAQGVGARLGYPVDPEYISRLERGVVTWPHADHRAALRAHFGVASDAELGFYCRRSATAPPWEGDGRRGAAPAALPEDEDMRRRKLMGLAAKLTVGAGLASGELAILATPAAATPLPDRIGMGDVQRVAEMTRTLQAQDMSFGGGSCRDAIIGYLNWAVQLRRSTMTEDIRRGLDRELADLEGLAGWSSYDLALTKSAEQFFLRSLHSAKQADAPALAASALERLGRMYFQDGHYDDAQYVFALATGAAQQASSPLLVANVQLQQARVHGRRGDIPQTEEALRRAQHEFSRAEPDPASWLVKIIDKAELHAMTGYAYSYLAEHDRSFADRAVEEVSSARRLRDPRRTRASLFDRTALALNCYRLGETDRANTLAADLLSSVPQVSSRRLLTRLAPLAAEAAGQHDSTATDIAHQLRGLIAV